MKIREFIETAKKYLPNIKKINKDEDCEGMSSVSTLSPSSTSYGGSITQGDTYAPGDNRMPKSLFNKPMKRKIHDEDAEERKKEYLDIAIREFLSTLEQEKIQKIENYSEKNSISFNSALIYFYKQEIYELERSIARQKTLKFLDDMKKELDSYE